MGLSAKLILVTVGVAVGSLLGGVQTHLRRGLGLIPFAVCGLLASLTWAAGSSDPRWPCLLMGLSAGIVSVPLRAFYQATVPADARGNAMAISNFAQYLLTVVLAGVLLILIHVGFVASLTGQLWLLAAGRDRPCPGDLAAFPGLSRAGARAGDSSRLSRSWQGPGLDKFPLRGPVIVIGNHSSWFDPLWVAKIVPRRLFPMMTSLFFDLPVLHWLMTRVVHAIRVPASFYRREAPELKEALAVLDRGDVLLLFPEGMLRRKDEQFLRQFGQGIWRILADRPDVPVVTCWIEGGWGSYMSYKGGPPLKNKRPDFWRPITIAFAEPVKMDRTLLADHRATRTFLMRACLENRRLLGLEVPAAPLQTDDLHEDFL